MNPAGTLVIRSDGLRDLCEAIGARTDDPGGFARRLGDGDLLALAKASQRLRRELDRFDTAIAGEIEHRSPRGHDDSLAKRLGERSAADLLARTTGTSSRAARKVIAVGTAIAPVLNQYGEELPPVHPHLAAALADSAISMAAGRAIISTLSAVKTVLSTQQLLDLEQQLVERAVMFANEVDTFLVFLKRVPDHIDGAGSGDREQALRSQRDGYVQQLPDGMTRVSLLLDPESAGYVVTALNSRTAPRRDRADDDDPAVAETRTSGQRLVDAMVIVAKQAMSVDEGRLAGSPVGMLVTLPLDAVTTGIGSATISGIEQPVSAGTARRMAAGAGIIPAVPGGRSEILDLGVKSRLYSAAQRAAMALRDQGCTWMTCLEPPGRCEAAHIDPARALGPTDLANGILLCPYHHHRFDSDGWTFRWGDDGTPWFTPPPHIDAARTPRRGGRPAMPKVA